MLGSLAALAALAAVGEVSYQTVSAYFLTSILSMVSQNPGVAML